MIPFDVFYDYSQFTPTRQGFLVIHIHRNASYSHRWIDEQQIFPNHAFSDLFLSSILILFFLLPNLPIWCCKSSSIPSLLQTFPTDLISKSLHDLEQALGIMFNVEMIGLDVINKLMIPS